MEVEQDLKAVPSAEKQKKRKKKKEKTLDAAKSTEDAQIEERRKRRKKKKKEDTVDDVIEDRSRNEKQAEIEPRSDEKRSKEKKKKKKKKDRRDKEGGENSESSTSSRQEPLETAGDPKDKKKKKGKGVKAESLSEDAGVEDRNQSSGSNSKKRKGTSTGTGEVNVKKRKQNEQEEGALDKVKPLGKAKTVAKDTVKKNGPTSAMKKSSDKPNTSQPEKKSKKSRRVSFSPDDEVFPYEKEYDESKLVRGRRFSKEEDQLIRDAVTRYTETNQLGEEGLQKVLKSSKHPEVKGCWKEISSALPWRPLTAVYCRAHVIYEMSEKRGFSKEEKETIRKFHAEFGPQWKKLSEILGKQRLHVKDAWRRIRLPNEKKGQWSQEEYQTLFDLVNLDLRIKAFKKRKSDNVMIREGISWEAISDKISTRTMSSCCHKWYDQLRSPLVARGVWADSDDYRLLDALQKQDACNVEDVDWDGLLEHRSGEVCRKRWDEMVRHIGGHRERTFIEQVDVLAKRYCGDMLQYRFKHQKEREEDEEEEEEEEERTVSG